jgi:hypothetical protein
VTRELAEASVRSMMIALSAFPFESFPATRVQTTITEGVDGSRREAFTPAKHTETVFALDAAGKMINNSKNLPRNPLARCFLNESSE